MACNLDVFVTSITGDCSNTSSGAFIVDVQGDAPGFTFQWVTPYNTTIPFTASTLTFTGLTAGTYTFYVVDSCIPDNTVTTPINVFISSGSCIEIIGISNTTCNLPTGEITALNTNYYGQVTYYLYENSLGLLQIKDEVEILSSQVTFNQLSPGTYYIISDDGGGCTGKTQSCIIKSSTTLDFGFYVQNTTDCGVNTGSIYVTGITGVPPYTYIWTNDSSNSFITGLTEGSYSVTIQDSTGCITSKGVEITNVPTMTITTLLATPPTCFGSDGEITAILTGGTAPYYFSGTNGEVAITFATSYTFTGLSSGFFGVKVTDAGLCNNTTSTSLFTPNSFSVLSVSTTNSICNNNGGSIDIFLVGGSGEYTYSLTDSSGNTTNVVIPATNYSFSNLASGVYTLSISNGGSCTYTQNYTINNTVLFTLSTSTTGTTCNSSDGVVTLSITSGGTPPFYYQINGNSITTSLLSYTFSGLSSGNYVASVTDAFFCEQTANFFIPSSNNLNFNFAGIGTSPGSTDGVIYTFVTSGEPPFTLDWSDNVPTGQTGYTITGLSAGTYSLTMTDDNGCTQSRDITLFGLNVFQSYELYNISTSQLEFGGDVAKRGIKQYLWDGFFDLTSGDTGCLLSQTIFEIEATLTGTTISETFYTGTTLFDYPSDNEMYEVVERVLLQFAGINNVFVHPLNNTIKIETVLNPSIGLFDAQVVVSLKINYDINCVSCS
jgi:hypothetical protein